MSILQKIDEVVKDNLKNRHSYFQLKHFVIGKELTNQGRIHACICEMSARKSSMEALILEIEETKDLVDLIEIDIEELKNKEDENDYNKKRNKIKLKQLERKKLSKQNRLSELQEKIKGFHEEAIYFYNAYEQMCKIEEPKDWDDPGVQKEYWNAKFLEELNSRFLLGLPIDTELVRSMSALPEDSSAKVQLIKFLEDKSKKLGK